MSKYDIGRKEKQSKLIEYLLKITQATRKAILYIPTDYGEENILWFSDFVDTNCTLKDWSNTDDELLKVRRKQEPVKPSIPEMDR